MSNYGGYFRLPFRRKASMDSSERRWNANIKTQPAPVSDHRREEKRANLFRPTGNSAFPIRLMHVVDLLALAGMEYGVIKLVNCLDPKVFSPSICCLRIRNADTGLLLNPGIPVYEMNKRPGLDLGLVFRLAALLRSQKVEVVHSHNWPTYFHAVIAAKIARTPVLIHGEHGRDDREMPIRRLLINRLLAKSVDHFVAVSSDLAGDLAKLWRVSPARISLIANGVDLDRFAVDASHDGLRHALGLTAENRVILNIGRLRPVKDPWTLLRAFATVHARMKEARLLIVGSDQGTGVQEKLETFARDLGIRDTVMFAGVRQNIPAFLNLSDIYVNCSVYEGMSNTILEAMAAAKPVIATSVGGNPELVKHGETGYLVPAQDDRLLAARMLDILTDPQLKRSMGAAGRRAVEVNHQLSGMVERYAELYRNSLLRYENKITSPAAERVKKAAAHLFRMSGANYLRWLSGTNRLTIVGYHRVLPLYEAMHYPFQAMVMPKDLFEAQIAHLAKNYCPMSISDAIRLLRAGKLPRRALIVTFDDGYHDNYEHAYPILRRFQVPASFFVVTDFVDGKTGLWWDEVAGRIEQILRCRLLQSSEDARHLPQWALSIMGKARSPEEAPVIARDLVGQLNRVSSTERRKVFDLLCSIAAGFGEATGKKLMLSWKEVKELHDSGMTIGSHTASHEFLDEAEEAAAWREIHESVTILKQRLNTPARFLTYPAGRCGRDSSILLRRAGIEAAITSRPGSNNSRTDIYHLKRYDAGYSYLRSGFSSAVFDMELQGWLSPFRAVFMNQLYT
jgi:sugar transferase (PEP-CTERM/EpsH1 system associated)